jgi:hypothetical protein
LIIGIISAVIIIGVIITIIVVLLNKKKDNEDDYKSINDNTDKSKENTTNSTFLIENKTVILNNGIKMPILGLGTWTLSNDEAEESTYVAIKTGYRLIDTAEYYGNDKGVGLGIKKAIKEGIIKREDIFITTKIMPGAYSNPDIAIEDS